MTAGGRGVVISALGLTQILAWGSSYYLLAVLAVPIAADTGWPMAWIVAGLSLGLLVAGAVSPLVGRLVSEHGGRPVLAGSAALLGLGLFLLGVAPALPVYLAGWVFVGAGMGAGLYDAAFATLGALYREKARPAITQLTLWGGFASTICWPLSAFLVERLGWRGACFVYAAIQVGMSLPLLVLALRGKRTGDGPGLPKRERGSPSHALAGTERLAFLVLGGIFVLVGVISSIVSVHLLTLLQARGIGLAAAVSLGALIGPSQVTARVIEMMGGGRHHPFWTLAAATILIAFGVALLWAGLPVPALALVLYGGGNGIYSIARGTLPLALFGPDRYPVLMGRLATPGLVAAALAPSAGAVLLSHAGESGIFSLLLLLALANVGLVSALGPLVRRDPG